MAVYREHGRLYGPCARYCTYRVHGRSRRVRIVYIGVQGPCTWCVHGHVQSIPTRSGTLYTALFTARVHGRSRPCTDLSGHVQTVYTAVHEPRTWSVRDPITAVYAARTWPCTVNTAVLYGPCARYCTYRVHGRSRCVRIVYIGVQGPCTWCVHGHVQGTPTRSGTLYTAFFTARVHGRSRPCTDLSGHVQSVYTAVHEPRTWSVRDPITAVYAARTWPCTVNTAVFTARVHGIVRTVYTAVHGVYGSCTSACKDRVHGASTAMYRVHLHGRVLCTRPCLRPVYTPAHGRVQT